MTNGGGRLSISLCIIARDEERDLPAAIVSAPFASEVIVVIDAATADGTRAAARAADAADRPVRIFERSWPGHVAQKNFALEQATCEWALSLDADERVSPELDGAIRAVFSRGPAAGICGFAMNRRTRYLGRWMRGSGWYPDSKLRLVRRGRARWEGTDPHDRLAADGPIARLEGDLLHESYRDLSDHLRKLDAFTSIAAGEKARRGAGLSVWGHPVWRMLVQPPARFLKMFLWKRGWRDGLPGAIAAGMGTLYVFLKYAKLWEIHATERRLAGGSVGLDPSLPPRGRP